MRRIKRTKKIKSSFSIWYEENKESDELNESYREYVNDLKQTNPKETPEPRMIWARENFEVDTELPEPEQQQHLDPKPQKKIKKEIDGN